MIKKDSKAGSRWNEFFTICELITENSDQFTSQEADFCDRLLTRLQSYKEDTFITVAQINWLKRLDEQANQLGLK